MDMDMETNQISVSVSAKEGEKLTFQELTEASDQVMKRISDIKGIDTIGAMAGGNSTSSLMGGGNDSVSMYILLDEDADVKVSDVTDAITEKTKDLDCEVSTNTSSMDYSSYFGSGLSVRIKGNDIETLQKLAGEVADVMKDTKGTTDIDDGMEDSEPQLTISVDKKKGSKIRTYRSTGISACQRQDGRQQDGNDNHHRHQRLQSLCTDRGAGGYKTFGY